MEAGGSAPRTVGRRSLFGLATMERGSRGTLGSTLGLTLVHPSAAGCDLNPNEVIPGGTPGDEVEEEQVGVGVGATCR